MTAWRLLSRIDLSCEHGDAGDEQNGADRPELDTQLASDLHAQGVDAQNDHAGEGQRESQETDRRQARRVVGGSQRYECVVHGPPRT